MTVSSAEVATTSSQLSSAARWLAQVGDTHVRATRAARGAFASLPTVWRGPAADLTARAGTGLIERVQPVGPQLVEAASTVDRVANRGAPIAERLRSLEREEQRLSAELRSATSQATGAVDPELADRAARRAGDLRARLTSVQRSHEHQGATWEQACGTAAAQIAAAAASVRSSSPSFDVALADGGTGGAGPVFHPDLRDRLERLRDLAKNVTDAFAVAHAFVEHLHERLHRWVVQVRTTVVATASRLTVVLGRGLVASRDRLHVVITQTREWLYVPPPVWLRRLHRVLGRLRPLVRGFGDKLPAIGGGLSGWERWNRDADRVDTTSTERWLRAGTEAVVRTVPQLLVGWLTVSAAAAVGVASGPFAVIAVPLVLAAGVGAGTVVDGFMSSFADKLLDEWQRSQDLIRWTADRVDDAGRWVADRATSVWNGLTGTWDTLSSTAGDAWETVTDVASSGWGGVSDVVSRRWEFGYDVASSTRDLLGEVVATGRELFPSVSSPVDEFLLEGIEDITSWRPTWPSFGGGE